MTLIKNKFIFIGILTFSIAVLIFTYFVEHVLKHAPCNLCLIERIPYVASIILVSLVVFFEKYEKIILITLGLFFVFGTSISFYHFGIEQGFFSESLVCDLGNGDKAVSAQDLLKQLEKKTISCKDVTFKLFGLSLATFNTIISLFLSVIMLKIVINDDKNR